MDYKKLIFLCFCLTSFFCYSEEEESCTRQKVCKKCEEIREYNKTHHKNYEYFDDFLKDEENQAKTDSPNNS